MGGRNPRIFVEQAEVLVREDFAAGQHHLRLHAPRTAGHARPGCFVHLRCDAALPMRRPMSVMRCDPVEGWVDLLFKEVGVGTRALAGCVPGVRLDLLGPIGTPFVRHPERPDALLIGGGVGIPPMVFLAERLRASGDAVLLLMGSEVPFPFTPVRSRIEVPGIAPQASAAMPLLEEWGIASRLASANAFAGCYPGWVTELARQWLEAQAPARRARLALYACGPTGMLAAAARLAEEFDMPCQVSLEEFMACAVGGCAGCAVRMRTPDGPAMRRVCVDGPVFDGAGVDWQALGAVAGLPG